MSQSTTPSAATTPSSPSTPSTTSTPLSKEASPDRGQKTAAQLEQVCKDSVLAVNRRDLEYVSGNLYKFISPTFKAHFDNFPHPLTMIEHSTLLRQTIDRFPDFHVVVKSVSSDVDEDAGIASVYMETMVSGAPPEIRTTSVNEYRWRRDRGQWKCWLHTGMKGISEYL